MDGAGASPVDDDLDAILDELYARHVRLPLQPGEFSAGMFGRHHGMTTSQTSSAIERMLKAGAIELVLDGCGQPVLRQVGQHAARVYRRRE